MNREAFKDHMIEKAKGWECKNLFLGPDFAVFEFNYMYQAANADKNLQHYACYYAYRTEYDDKLKLCIINKAGIEEGLTDAS
jgi:hypothetical protein